MLSSGMASAGRKEEEQMRVSSSKSGSRRASHNGKALTGLQPGRHLPRIYICVCVEYRHICMPTFPRTKNQRVQPIE